jgi:hypothetical protein
MKNKTLLIFTAIVLILTFGCKEKQEPEQRNQAIFDYYKKEVQTFILTDKVETLIGKEGTKITIDPKSLEIVGGNEISGNIEIQLTEYYQSEDIILANLSTSSNSNLIETGGMIKLTASSNGQEVVVKNGEEFQIEFSSSEKKGMEIFHGESKNGQLNWLPKAKPTQVNKAGFFAQAMAQEEVSVFEQVDTAIAVAITEADSIVRKNILQSSKFGWINCDRFLELDNLTTVKISYDTVFKPSAYLIFKEINSIMPCFYEKTYGKFINLPIGHEATLIAFSLDGEKIFFSTKEILIDEEMELKIYFDEVPLDDIKEKIKTMIE